MNRDIDIYRFGHMCGIVSSGVNSAFLMVCSMESEQRRDFLAHQLCIIGLVLPDLLILGNHLGYFEESDLKWLSDWSRYTPGMSKRGDVLDMICELRRLEETRLSTLLREFRSKWDGFLRQQGERFQTVDGQAQQQTPSDE